MEQGDKELVQQTFSAVAPRADEAAAMFYNRLFEIAPTVRPLFKADLKDQGKKLMKMLATAVAGLDNLNALVPAVQELGKRHIDYGVKAEHYPPVGEALLWTLGQALGDDWTPETAAAWTNVYGVLSDTMIEAAYPVAAE